MNAKLGMKKHVTVAVKNEFGIVCGFGCVGRFRKCDLMSNIAAF